MRADEVYKWPRRTCVKCGRSVAVMPSGRYMRHDPPGRRAIGAPLVSCAGSLEAAPGNDGSQQAELFHVEDVELSDDPLFTV